MRIIGNRTYSVCAVIIVLAFCQKFLGVRVPDEVWLALFGLAIAFLRFGLPPPASAAAAFLCAALLCAGCVNQSSVVNLYGVGPAATNDFARVSGPTNLLSGTIAISVGLDMYAPKTVTPDSTLTLTGK
jgi:hypothetical protein